MLRRLAVLFAALAALAGCSNMTPDRFADAEPRLALEEYFQGRSRAYGLVEDRFGNVRRQFVVDIEGTWDGRDLILVEDFTWSDGEVEQRIWTLTKGEGGRWQGRAADVIGVADGIVSGNAFNLRYHLDLKMGSRRMKVHFDDWMFLQADGVLLNRAVMSKWGVHLATITIAFRRLEEPAPAPVQQAQGVPAATAAE